MGLSPKRRWLMVTPPVFLESYWKYAWMYLSVWSPMILVEFLLAPTVPSPPRPQNLQLLGAGGGGDGGGLDLRQAQVGHVVDDANGEAGLGGVLLQLLVNSEHAGRRGVLAAQAVAAAGQHDVVQAGLTQGGGNVPGRAARPERRAPWCGPGRRSS